MKRIVIVFISLVIVSFTAILFMVKGDSDNKIKERIVKNIGIKEIHYLNQYDNYYLVMDDKYLYVISGDYKELLKIDKLLIHDNISNYDIIYRDNQVMYMDDYNKNGKMVFKYYDLYTYKLIDEIVLGG